jgi:peptide methionine sulfoxide reductase MsrB
MGLMTDKIDKSKIDKTDEQWRKELSKEQYNVLRKEGTERSPERRASQRQVRLRWLR